MSKLFYKAMIEDVENKNYSALLWRRVKQSRSMSAKLC